MSNTSDRMTRDASQPPHPARVARWIIVAACLLSAAERTAAGQAAPHLERRGGATQLIVDGRPFLILGGELSNTAPSSPARMEAAWPVLARMNLNTVLAGASWAQVEPEEGRFDFSSVDSLLDGARRHGLHLVLLWFGSWKNGLSSFAPAWVKRDTERFPRVEVAGGHPLEVLSPLGEAARRADARAFAAFQRHLRAADGGRHTVLMIQLENEVGVLGDSRDRSVAAEAEFGRPVPKPLVAFLEARRGRLRPELRRLWEAAGARAAGRWDEIFGPGPATGEIFMAWQYATYLDEVAAAGKAEYPLPIFTNTWIVQPEDKGPGDYPSGGPEPLVLDIWRAGAPHIDLNAPDIYLPDFSGWCDRFAGDDNPLFVPESRGDAAGVANAFYAIGQRRAIGYSPFGIDEFPRLGALPPDPAQAGSAGVEALPLPRAYALLRQLAPLILRHQAAGTIAAAAVNREHPAATLSLGGYELAVGLRKDRRDPAQSASLGCGMFFAVGPDQFLAAGADIEVTFRPLTAGPPIAGLARVESGSLADGQWRADRILNGDDVVIRYDLAAAAAESQSGSGLRFLGPQPGLQRVELYRYR